MTVGERIKLLRDYYKVTQTELAEIIGTTKQNIYKYENGIITNIPSDKIELIAKHFHVSPAYLMGWMEGEYSDKWVIDKSFNDGYPIPGHFYSKAKDEELTKKLEPTSNIAAVYDDHIRMIPVYESVSAGFGAFADNTITDYQPVRIVSDSEAAETICIRVTGDSMYPKIEDGDIIQVRKQDSVDSGDIAVMLLDGDEGLVKRVVYGRDWIELHSINPMYPVQRYEGADVQRLRVVGLVRGVFHAF